MDGTFLYAEIEAAKKFGISKEIPQFILDNLSSNISIRDYQKSAFENTLIYLEGELSKNKQTHILYHMATGSGKTVIMVMDILYYFSKGYRNFLFFTNQTNIVSKTRINFLDSSSSKYLFANTVNIGGTNIKIREVSNFQESDPNAINICFDTVQGIHSSLSLIKEGSLSIEDFEDQKIVLIADEAHHLNSTTAKDKEENEENATWEDTVNRIFYANKDNVLLEYTATCDLQDANVKQKYIDKIVFNFDLREFRKAGYTKEFLNLQSDTTKWGRSLQAIIISQYRKLMFEKHNISIKPVVLLKSKTISDSNSFYAEFYQKLKHLNSDEIASIKEQTKDNGLFKAAFDFFDDEKISNESLAELIKLDFAQEHSVNMNALNPENEQIVNNLDEKNNHYRLIFIVDKLTEGWDVLSLFDIVRLYETRQGGPRGTVSKYTISEAQLIGRGARYCPFKFSDDQPREKRKYSDYSIKESICETLLYHCMQDSRYIDELKKALKATGLLPENEPIKVTYTLKPEFKKTKLYNEGYVFLNDRVEVSRNGVTSLPEKVRTEGVSFRCKSNNSVSAYLLADQSISDKNKKVVDLPPIKFKKLPLNILFKAYRSFEQTLSFDKLKKQFPNLKNAKEFLLSDDYLGGFPITFFAPEGEQPSYGDMLEASLLVLQKISDYVQKIEITFVGTKEFKAYPIREKFTDRTRNVTREKDDESWGNGVSQASDLVDSRYRIELINKEWYAYNDNYGTSEEKKFVKYFSTVVEDLKKKYNHVSLIRNEIQVAIYSFDDGQKFEPDYVLLLEKDKEDSKNTYVCLFVEPKGSHLLEKDKWKNTFLLQLQERGIPVINYADDNEYFIWGTPFYNESETKAEFIKSFEEAIDKYSK